MSNDENEYAEDIDYEEPADPIPSGAEVEGLDRADWHLSQILELRDRAKVEDALYKLKIDALVAGRKARAAHFEKRAGWHEKVLRDWHRVEVGAGRADGKRITLPSGHIQLRAAKELEITDEDELRAWLNGLELEEGEETDWEAVVYRVTEQFMPSELKKIATTPPRRKGDGLEPGSVVPLLTEDGEEAEGVQARILPDTWTVSR